METQDGNKQFSQGTDRQGKPSAAGQEMATSGGSETKFREPRSWAMKWDGFALSGFGGRRPDSSEPRS